MAVIPVSELTEVVVSGNGVFDTLMRATKEHLEQEFTKGRIKGPEYATVYLGALESVMRTSLEFLVAGRKAALEAQLLEQQILLAQVEVQKAGAQLLEINARTGLVEAQKANAEAELLIIQANALKIPAEIALLEQQKLNLVDDLLTNAVQRDKIEQETLNLVSQGLHIVAETALTTQRTANAVLEGEVLVAQECKLRAEFDNLMANLLKTGQETALLTQKVVTERAQTSAVGVDPDSVIGKQKNLYQAQTDGFKRDAENKVAKIMIDTWNVRRTTDEGTVADGTNQLSDSHVGRAVSKLLAGVDA